MLDIRDVFSNLLGLFLLIGVGYGAVRFGILPASASKLFTPPFDEHHTACHSAHLTGSAL